jgi:hypothetical protein
MTTQQEIAASFVVAALDFVDVETANAAGVKLRKVNFNFEIVRHADGSDVDEPVHAHASAPASAWRDSEQFAEAVKRIIGGDPRAFSLEHVDLVPRVFFYGIFDEP